MWNVTSSNCALSVGSCVCEKCIASSPSSTGLLLFSIWHVCWCVTWSCYRFGDIMAVTCLSTPAPITYAICIYYLCWGRNFKKVPFFFRKEGGSPLNERGVAVECHWPISFFQSVNSQHSHPLYYLVLSILIHHHHRHRHQSPQNHPQKLAKRKKPTNKQQQQQKEQQQHSLKERRQAGRHLLFSEWE